MKSRDPSRFRAAFERGFADFRDRRFGPLLNRAIDHRYLTIGIVLMLFLLAVAMPVGGKLKFTGFPDIGATWWRRASCCPRGRHWRAPSPVVAHLTDVVRAINEDLRADQPGGQDLVQNLTVLFGETRRLRDRAARRQDRGRPAERRDPWHHAGRVSQPLARTGRHDDRRHRVEVRRAHHRPGGAPSISA